MNETLCLKSKTSTKVFGTESKDRNPKPSFDLISDPFTSEPSYLDCLENLTMSTIRKSVLVSIIRKRILVLIAQTNFQSLHSNLSLPSNLNLHLYS